MICLAQSFSLSYTIVSIRRQEPRRGRRNILPAVWSEMGTGRERQHFLDVLRVAAACAVVMIHTVTGVRDTTDMNLYQNEDRIFLTLLDMVCWSVPVFILISGYLFLDPERKISFRTMLTKYCRRVALALLVFGVPYACLELVMAEGAFRPGMVWESVGRVLQGKTWSHMWYLYLVLFLYLVTPALKWVLGRLPMGVVYAFLAVLFLGCSIVPFAVNMAWLPLSFWILPDSGIYLFYYVWGYVFACWRGKGKRLSLYLALPAALLALGMAISRIAGGYSLVMAYNYPFTVALSLCIFGTGLAARPSREHADFWEAASALSFGVYLIHPVFLNLAYKFLNVTLLSFPLWQSLPLFYLGTLLLAVSGTWLLRKVPVMRKYVL